MSEAAPWIGAPEDIAPYVGFVYLITLPSGKMYLGKKIFWSAVKKKPLKGQKRCRRSVKESDWKTYFGSSNELKEILKEQGPAGFKREILHLCTSKWELAYLEAKEQILRGVMLSEDYLNGVLNLRIGRPPFELLERLRKSQ